MRQVVLWFVGSAILAGLDLDAFGCDAAKSSTLTLKGLHGLKA